VTVTPEALLRVPEAGLAGGRWWQQLRVVLDHDAAFLHL